MEKIDFEIPQCRGCAISASLRREEKSPQLRILRRTITTDMSGSSNSLPSAHHYLPRFYLKGFTEKKQLWVYEKGKPPRASKPKYEAQRENYYRRARCGWTGSGCY